MKNALLISLIALAVPTTALGDHWAIVTGNDTQAKLVNFSNLKRNGDIVKAWVANVNIDPATPFDLDLQRVSVNCFDESMNIDASYEYLKGKNINTPNLRPEWNTPPPGSIGQAGILAMCEKDATHEIYSFVYETSSIQKEVPKIQKILRDLRKKSKAK